MLDLVLDCGVFIAVESGRGNFYQLSGNSPIDYYRSPELIHTGIPLSELRVFKQPALPLLSRTEQATPAKPRTMAVTRPYADLNMPGAITLVRNRMFYARAALNAKGEVRFGLRHIRKPAVRKESRPVLTYARCLESVR